mmetsp:Transcript_7424/g.8143  ORF Transcript_7424/g.8143 Transcript_7424/m.8143 type:complete len:89 (+) Transcript_7424:517-783(+)
MRPCSFPFEVKTGWFFSMFNCVIVDDGTNASMLNGSARSNAEATTIDMRPIRNYLLFQFLICKNDLTSILCVYEVSADDMILKFMHQS